MPIVNPSTFAPADNTLLGLLSASSGSSLVGFIQAGTGAVLEDQQSRGRWFVLATDRMSTVQRADVSSNGGLVDVLAALNTAITDAVANRLTLIFPAGTYTISGKLELGFAKLKVMALGHVIINHTGTGAAVSFDAGAGAANIYDIHFGWGNPFYINGNVNTTDLVYTRGCHHMRVNVNARNGITVVNMNFSVLSKFIITSSVNEGAFTLRPTNCLVTNRRAVGENNNVCEFYITAEGMASYGLDLQYCETSTFLGSSEGNLAGGVNVRSTSSGNIFIEMDNESNGSTNADWLVAGDRNIFIGAISAITSASPATSVTGKRNQFIGGQLSTLTVASGADYNVFNGVAITSTVTLTSLLTTMVNCADNTGTPIADVFPEVAWTTYVPAISSTIGTITSSSATGRYKSIGKTVFFEMDITITTNGTGAGILTATLPFTSAASVRSGFGGSEYATTGHSICCEAGPSTTTLNIRKYDTTYPAVSGNKFVINGVYEKT